MILILKSQLYDAYLNKKNDWKVLYQKMTEKNFLWVAGL